MIKNKISTNAQESMHSKTSSDQTKKSGEVKATTRRKPSQERSIERHYQILKAAESCILEVGAANLKILDIARASNMSHASIYQYFNNREEIISALLIKSTQEFYDEAMALFALATNETAFVKFFENLIHAFHSFVKSNLTYQEIWWGSQGWEAMRYMDLQDNVRYAEAFSTRIQRFRPDIEPERSKGLSLLLVEFITSIIRNAVKVGGKTESIMVEEMVKMSSSYLVSLFKEPSC